MYMRCSINKMICPASKLSSLRLHIVIRNMSAYNVTGFSTLPNNIQDFLLYRHCRRFPMLLDVPNKCGGPQNSADVFLLLAIKSSPENYDRREVLRKTWAEERLHKGVWIRRVFITGWSKTNFEKNRLNNLLKLENSENKDIYSGTSMILSTTSH